MVGIADVAFECSFTAFAGTKLSEAESVIATLQIREWGRKYPAECIPVRLSEVYQINEAYELVSNLVRQELKKDFQGKEKDISSLQCLVDSGKIGLKKRDVWLAFGIVICVILTNEVEDAEWRTLIDGNREVPVLWYHNRMIDPMKLVWSEIKAGRPCSLEEAYQLILG